PLASLYRILERHHILACTVKRFHRGRPSQRDDAIQEFPQCMEDGHPALGAALPVVRGRHQGYRRNPQTGEVAHCHRAPVARSVELLDELCNLFLNCPEHLALSCKRYGAEPRCHDARMALLTVAAVAPAPC